MLDVKAIREDPEPFRRGLARRDLAGAVDEILALDERRRSLTARVEDLRAAQNRASKAIGRAQDDEKQTLIAEVGQVSAELKQLEPELAAVDGTLSALLAETPNVPHESAPDGFTDEDAVEIRRRGEPPHVRVRAQGSRRVGRVARRLGHGARGADERLAVRVPPR